MRRRVFALGEYAMMGTSGRARLTVIALEPLSVKATMYFAPISRAVLHAPRAMASATLVARDTYGACSKNGLVSASIAMRRHHRAREGRVVARRRLAARA